MSYKLLSVNADTKTTKGLSKGYLTGILYLAPLNIAGCGNVCPNASKGCAMACLYTAGRGVFSNVQQARINKTKRFFANKSQFMLDLCNDIDKLIKQSIKLKLKPCIRLNGTSDINFSQVYFRRDNNELTPKNIFMYFKGVQFYDYTKDRMRVLDNNQSNYYLLYSRRENDHHMSLRNIIKLKKNVAIVFKNIPKLYAGIKVINGDNTDIRFLDKQGVIIGLSAKGRARYDKTGFVL